MEPVNVRLSHRVNLVITEQRQGCFNAITNEQISFVKNEGLTKAATLISPDYPKETYQETNGCAQLSQVGRIRFKKEMAEKTRRTGQLIKRGDDTWLVRVYLGEDANGKRKYHNETFKGTKKEADKVLRKVLEDRDKGLLGDARKQTLKEYLGVWLENIAKPRLEYRTFKDYNDLLERYVYQPLGKIKLYDLKAIHIQKLYSDMQARGLSPRVVRYTHSVLSSALKKAVELDVLPRNVATLVQLPKQTRKEMDVLTQKECVQFLHKLKDERFAALFSFALATGMRPEEYLALQWKDIDLEKGTATVRRALVTHRKGGGWHFGEPKTKKSRRTLPLPKSIIRELQAHRRQQGEARLKLGSAWQNYDLVFPSELGTPLNPPNVTRHFKRILKDAELRTSIRLYDLRHTCATLLLQAGINPKIVSERLGHSTIVLTLDVYSHVLPNMQEAASDELDRLIFKQSGTQ
ncbi:MAG TPA: site-specific integrase [Pyrinomonadaceae bacterium]